MAFFRDIAWRFVTRSGLGTHSVQIEPCMGHHVRWWPLVYAAALFQPMSWGFLVLPSTSPRHPSPSNARRLSAYTLRHFQ